MKFDTSYPSSKRDPAPLLGEILSDRVGCHLATDLKAQNNVTTIESVPRNILVMKNVISDVPLSSFVSGSTAVVCNRIELAYYT